MLSAAVTVNETVDFHGERDWAEMTPAIEAMAKSNNIRLCIIVRDLTTIAGPLSICGYLRRFHVLKPFDPPTGSFSLT